MKLRQWMQTIARTALLVLAVGCSAMPEPQDQRASAERAPSLRVMTFNIRYGTAPDGNHVWTLRRPVLFTVIDAHDPEILGVQEALRFQLDELRERFPTFAEVGVGRDDGRSAGEYSAILLDTTRLNVLGYGTFWLSDTPDVPGSTTWGNRYTRVATWAQLRDRTGGRLFYVFNTHWDHESQPARERSAQLILQQIRQRADTLPVLLLGDFNAGETNAAFQALLADSAVRLVDTFRTQHPSATAVRTYHAFRGDTLGDKIDAILATAHWQVLDAAIDHYAEAGRYPSDHFPVTATLRLRAGQ